MTQPTAVQDPGAGARDDLTLGLFGAALAVTAWGSAGVLIKDIDMGGLAIGVYRFSIYSLAIVAWMQVRGVRLSWRAVRHSLWGGIALGLDVALFFTAVKVTTIVNATIIGALQPVVVMAIASRMFGERIRVRDVALSLVALAGVVIVVSGSAGSASGSFGGDLAAVGALFAWSAYFVFSRRSQGVISPTEYTAATALITAAINAPLAVAFGQDLSWPTGQSWVWLLVLAFGAGVIGHSLMNWSLVRIPLWVGSTFTLLIPVVAAALAWLVLDEPLTALQMVGIAVVLVTLAVIVRSQTVS